MYAPYASGYAPPGYGLDPASEGHAAGYETVPSAGAPLDLNAVIDVQRALNLLLAYAFFRSDMAPKRLDEDNNLGRKTRASIRAFQAATYLPVTGLLDSSTRSMLASTLGKFGIPAMAGAPASAMAAGVGIPMTTIASVGDVQRALSSLGFPNVPITGEFGPELRVALIAFQKHWMLPPTGEIDLPTRTVIAKALGQIGIPAFVPAASAGAAHDRADEIKRQALGALYELREIGVTAVRDSLRRIIAEPHIATLYQLIGFLGQPDTGKFANQVAELWKGPYAAYVAQPNPDAALAAAVQVQMMPLLTQVENVLNTLNHLATSPTVDNLNGAIGTLSQPQSGPLGAKVAEPLRAFLAAMNA